MPLRYVEDPPYSSSDRHCIASRVDAIKGRNDSLKTLDFNQLVWERSQAGMLGCIGGCYGAASERR